MYTVSKEWLEAFIDDCNFCKTISSCQLCKYLDEDCRHVFSDVPEPIMSIL